jgi:hypothetical protein
LMRLPAPFLEGPFQLAKYMLPNKGAKFGR